MLRPQISPIQGKILRFLDHVGSARPRDIENVTGFSPRTVRRALTALVSRHYIEKLGRPQVGFKHNLHGSYYAIIKSRPTCNILGRPPYSMLPRQIGGWKGKFSEGKMAKFSESDKTLPVHSLAVTHTCSVIAEALRGFGYPDSQIGFVGENFLRKEKGWWSGRGKIYHPERPRITAIPDAVCHIDPTGAIRIEIESCRPKLARLKQRFRLLVPPTWPTVFYAFDQCSAEALIRNMPDNMRTFVFDDTTPNFRSAFKGWISRCAPKPGAKVEIGVW